MGDACQTCNGTGKVGGKEERGSGVSRPCYTCGGTGRRGPGPLGRRK